MFLATPARAQTVHAYHQGAMPQRENACAAFALTCLLRGLGFESWHGRQVDQDLTAYLAGMVALEDAYPADADPGTALQAAWGFERQYEYPLRRSSRLAEVGTGPQGLTAALDVLTHGGWTAVPVSGRRCDGDPLTEADVWALVDCLLAPEHAGWRAQVLFNYQTGHLAALTGSGQGWGDVLFGAPPGRCEWDVGHVTSLAGVVAAVGGRRALVVRDSSPLFGWRGYHAESAAAVAAALARSDGSQGGALVLCPTDVRPVVEEVLRSRLQGCVFEAWDNGSRFVAPDPL